MSNRTIRTNGAPKPVEKAGAAAKIMAGPASAVCRDAYSVGPDASPYDLRNLVTHGDIIVEKDRSANVRSMWLRYEGQDIPMPNGFEDEHIKILLESAGYIFEGRRNVFQLANSLANLSTSSEMEKSGASNANPDWIEDNTMALDGLISQARQITGIEPELDFGSAAPGM